MKDNLTSRAQTLRKQMTKEERWLWYGFLRNHPIQFRRQVVFAPYIVDFYAHRARLAIELDGSGHYEPAQMQYDEKRTDILRERYGVYVLRFTNLEIQRQFRAVCEQIDNCIAQRLPLGGSWHGEAVTDEGQEALTRRFAVSVIRSCSPTFIRLLRFAPQPPSPEGKALTRESFQHLVFFRLLFDRISGIMAYEPK